MKIFFKQNFTLHFKKTKNYFNYYTDSDIFSMNTMKKNFFFFCCQISHGIKDISMVEKIVKQNEHMSPSTLSDEQQFEFIFFLYSAFVEMKQQH